MRIAEIHIYQKDLEVSGKPYAMAWTQLRALDTTIIKIVSDTGLIGWGEVCPLGSAYQPEHALGARAALVEMAPGLVGETLFAPLLVYRTMDELLSGHGYAKAAVDIAVLDLLGKHYKAKVCNLLGGGGVDSVPSYYAVGVDNPDEMMREAKEKVGEGYSRLQIKAGGRAVEVDIEAIRRIWEALGTRTRLVVDANRSLTTTDTLRLSLECADIPIILEQPCNTLEEIASIRKQIRHPIYLDENIQDINSALKAIALDLCDGFGLKLTRLGGLTPLATVRDICAARSIPHTCDDAWGGDIIAAACVHMGATVQPRLLEGVWIAAPYIDEHYDPDNGIKIENGSIKVPGGYGLGINLDENWLGNPIQSFS